MIFFLIAQILIQALCGLICIREGMRPARASGFWWTMSLAAFLMAARRITALALAENATTSLSQADTLLLPFTISLLMLISLWGMSIEHKVDVQRAEHSDRVLSELEMRWRAVEESIKNSSRPAREKPPSARDTAIIKRR